MNKLESCKYVGPFFFGMGIISALFLVSAAGRPVEPIPIADAVTGHTNWSPVEKRITVAPPDAVFTEPPTHARRAFDSRGPGMPTITGLDIVKGVESQSIPVRLSATDLGNLPLSGLAEIFLWVVPMPTAEGPDPSFRMAPDELLLLEATGAVIRVGHRFLNDADAGTVLWFDVPYFDGGPFYMFRCAANDRIVSAR